MADVAAQATSATRFRTALLTAFACVALTLAALGLGSVVAFQVTQRRREMGLRMALGATDTQLVAMMVRRGVGLAAIGAASGIVFALILARLLGHLLFGVGAADPVVMLTVPVVFLATAFVAATLPALHVTRLYPAVALREE
jgi:putative ABC transport system permease protein